MSFRDSISMLQYPYADGGSPDASAASLDDVFLNFSYDFTFDDDVAAPVDPSNTTRAADAFLTPDLTLSGYGDRQDQLDLGATYTLDNLPRAAIMGPNRVAATPATALAHLERKRLYPGNAVSSLSMPPVKERRDAEFEANEGDFVFDPPSFLSEPPSKKQKMSEESAESSPSASETVSAASVTPPQTPSPAAAPAAANAGPVPTGGAIAPDKRLRNNQASARFRAKKKLREMQVENTARDAIIRAEILERRVKEMEMEVVWLRGLVAGGSGSASGDKPDTERTVKSLKQIYEENGVLWREGSLQVVGNGPAVSGGALPPPSWGVTDEGEVYALPVAQGSMDALSAQLAELHKAQQAPAAGMLTGFVPAALNVQLALPPPAKRGRPPKKLVNVPNVPQPVATLGKVAVPGGVLVGGINVAGLLPLLVQPAPAK